MEESPEQVLARLARHRDAVFRARGIPTEPRPTNAPPRAPGRAPAFTPRPAAMRSPSAAAPSPALAPLFQPVPARRPVAPSAGAWGGPGTTPTEFIPPAQPTGGAGWHLGQSAVLVTLLGLFLAALASAVAVVAFERLGSSVALGIVGVMTLGGVIAATRRVPTALWWTIGAVIGGALGHFS